MKIHDILQLSQTRSYDVNFLKFIHPSLNKKHILSTYAIDHDGSEDTMAIFDCRHLRMNTFDCETRFVTMQYR